MKAWAENTVLALALALPFLSAVALYRDVFRRYNFLLGGAYALAASVALLAFHAGLPSPVVVLAAFAAPYLVLGVAELACFRPLEHFQLNSDEFLIASLGLNIVLQQCLSIGFGDAIRFPQLAQADPQLITLAFQTPHAFSIGLIALASVAILLLTMNYSELGKRGTAFGENPSLFRSLQFKIAPMKAALLGVACGLIAVASLTNLDETGAYPSAGFDLVILAFIASLLGGPVTRARYWLAAIGVVVVEQAAAAVLPAAWQPLVLFATLLLVLAYRSLSERGATS